MKTRKIVWYFLLLGVLVASQGVPERPNKETENEEKKSDTDEEQPKVVPFDKDFKSDPASNTGREIQLDPANNTEGEQKLDPASNAGNEQQLYTVNITGIEQLHTTNNKGSVHQLYSARNKGNEQQLDTANITDFELLNTTTIEDNEQQHAKDGRRPVWNIAHMANSLKDVDFFLSQGANSIEADVTFRRNGEALYTYHGIPCDCFRWCLSHETVPRYLDYMRQITTPGNPRFKDQLVLLFLDLKLTGSVNSIAAGKDIARKLLEHYWNFGKPGGGGRAYIINSIPSINYADFATGFQQGLREAGASRFLAKIGYDFSDNEDLDKIRSSYQRIKINRQIWQSDGITNCLPRKTERLIRALNRRDEDGQSYTDKVYWWTVDKKSTMERVLNLGVDGVMTNYPSNMAAVLNDHKIKRIVRLATFADNPFIRYTPRFLQYRTALNESEEPELLYNI